MKAWSRLAVWLSQREGGAPLALFRILFGLTLLWDLADIGLSGAFEMLWLPKPEGYHTPSARDILFTTVPDTAFAIRSVYAASVAAAAALVAGIGARPAALVALLGAQYLFSLHGADSGSHDRLFTNGLWLLIFARSDQTLSLRCWLRNRQWTSTELIPAWPRLLLVYQLILMYVCTGVQKLGPPWWPNGDFLAVYYSVLLPHYARADWWWVAWLSPLTQLATIITLFWEMTWWVVLVWMFLRRTEERGGPLRRLAARYDVRSLYAIIGIGMHGTIWIMMNLGPFSPVTLSFYACLFRHEELVSVWKWLTERRPPNPAPENVPEEPVDKAPVGADSVG